jgi:hypothetical protein
MKDDQAVADSVRFEKDTLQPDKCSGPTVQEVHVDFLLEEEFSVDLNFLRRFIEAAGQHGTPLQIQSVGRSVCDQWGEADLVVVYKEIEGNGDRVALLIEDKIRAGFQPLQPDRYRERGDSGRGARWDRYWTCLVAPKSYVDSNRHHGFDAAVTLEQIKECLAVSEPKRREFKVRVIAQAIEKKDRTGVQVVDKVMTAFRTSYFSVFEKCFADQRKDVRMRPPGDTWSGDSWFEIRSTLLPPGAYINHKSTAGFVDLTFPNTNAALLKPIELCLEPGMRIEKTGKSAAIRLVVRKIDQFKDFDQERAKVDEALSDVRRLLFFYTRERDRLEPALKSARTVAVP